MTSTHATYGYLDNKAELTKRLARIEGQVRGLSRMVESERYCIDILTQLSAADTALQAVGLHLLDGHVNSCVSEALQAGNRKRSEQKIAELMAAIERFTKSK